jgi:hypothetical protein
VAFKEPFPGSSSPTLWGRLNASFRQNARDRAAADVDLETAQCIPDLRVAPAEVFIGQPDHQFSDVVVLPWSTGFSALPGPVVLPGRQLSKPRQNGAGPNDLAATLPFLGCGDLALQRQPPPLLRRERDPGSSGG